MKNDPTNNRRDDRSDQYSPSCEISGATSRGIGSAEHITADIAGLFNRGVYSLECHHQSDTGEECDPFQACDAKVNGCDEDDPSCDQVKSHIALMGD